MTRTKFSVLVLPLLLSVVGCDQKPSAEATASAQKSGEQEQKATPPAAAEVAAKASAATPVKPAEAARESQIELYPALHTSVSALLGGFDAIPSERKKQLKKLALFVQTKQSSGETAELTFICTHNSRRSHLSQLWAATAAAYYGVKGVKTYSGGTEVTAFNPRAVAAVERAGFRVEKPEGDNPHYQVTFSEAAPAHECFSKKYDAAGNPGSGFAAVMTCSEADKNCPTVEGASLRVALPFVDPKLSDGTPEETATYDARSRQIGAEMFYLFSLVQKA